jgi:myo-inositol 2-dehydrogenase / D-chiro-inositol 1-dehydrogenase
MKEALRIAIVGCGRMGLSHANSAARLGHRVVAACDLDAARAAALAAAHPGCEVLTDSAGIRWDEVDAGFVCTPPFARGPVELFAAKAGVPLFLEKPIGLSATQCLSALAAFRESGTLTSVGYMNRHRGSVRRARAILEAERVLGFTAHWICAAYRVPWWADPTLSGGQLNEQCTHLIDLARHLGGEIEEVDAIAQAAADDRGTAAVSMLLRFRSGALGTIICGCLANEKQIGLRVFTPKGQISLDGWDFRWSPSAAFGDGSGLDPGEDVFLDECRAFLEAVASGDGSGVLCDLAEAMRTQRVVDAVQSALRGRGRQFIGQERGVVGEGHAVDYI